jgi:hypothetical protein
MVSTIQSWGKLLHQESRGKSGQTNVQSIVTESIHFSKIPNYCIEQFMESGHLHGPKNWSLLPSIIWYKTQLVIIFTISHFWKLFVELHKFMLDKEMCPAVIVTPNISSPRTLEPLSAASIIVMGCLNCYTIHVIKEYFGYYEDVMFLGHARLLKNCLVKC